MTPDGAGAGPSSPSWRRALRSGLMAFVPVSRSLVHSLRTYRLEKGTGKNPLPELSRRSVLLPLRSGRATPHLSGEMEVPPLTSLGRNSGPGGQALSGERTLPLSPPGKGHGRSSGRYDALLPVVIKTIEALPSLR